MALPPSSTAKGNELHYRSPAQNFIDRNIVPQAGSRLFNNKLREYITEYNAETGRSIKFKEILNTLKTECGYKCGNSGGRFLVDCKLKEEVEEVK